MHGCVERAEFSLNYGLATLTCKRKELGTLVSRTARNGLAQRGILCDARRLEGKKICSGDSTGSGEVDFILVLACAGGSSGKAVASLTALATNLRHVLWLQETKIRRCTRRWTNTFRMMPLVGGSPMFCRIPGAGFGFGA